MAIYSSTDFVYDGPIIIDGKYLGTISVFDPRKKLGTFTKDFRNAAEKAGADLDKIEELMNAKGWRPDITAENTPGSMPTIVNTSRSEDVISVSWHVDDVLYNAKDKGIKGLTKADAHKVLEYVKRKHDASIGINWDVLTEWSQHVLDEKKAAKKSK